MDPPERYHRAEHSYRRPCLKTTRVPSVLVKGKEKEERADKSDDAVIGAHKLKT